MTLECQKNVTEGLAERRIFKRISFSTPVNRKATDIAVALDLIDYRIILKAAFSLFL